jgi:excisionase family DNA binding protein
MFLSMRQVCTLLNRSRWKVTQLIKAGELEAHKGPEKNAHYRITQRSLDRYIERHMINAGGGR